MEVESIVSPWVFAKGDRIQAVADGKLRMLVIEAVSSDQRLAQCSYTVGRAKHYAVCRLAGAIRIGQDAGTDAAAAESRSTLDTLPGAGMAGRAPLATT